MKTFEQKELAIHVKTQAEWDAVAQKMLDDPNIGKWYGREQGMCSRYWNEQRENTVIYSLKKNNYKITFLDLDFYKNKYYSQLPLQTAEEYLGYDVNIPTRTDYDKIYAGITKVLDEKHIYYPEQGLIFGKRLSNTNSTNINATKAQTFMSIISNTFKSKENKALEYFGLGTIESLSEQGRKEFIDFLWETLKEDKKAFLAKIVEAHKEDK